MKTFLTAAVLAVLPVTPAAAQQMGGSTEGSAMGSDSSGDMGGDAATEQPESPVIETEIPEAQGLPDQGLEGETMETQIPVTSPSTRPDDIETPGAQDEPTAE